jgi:hypothetical protein
MQDLQVLAVTFEVKDPMTHAGRRFLSDARGRTIDTWNEVAMHHFRQHMAEPLNWPAEGFDGIHIPAFEFTGIKPAPAAVYEAPRDVGRSCVCGRPDKPGVVHRFDGPCYHKEVAAPAGG